MSKKIYIPLSTGDVDDLIGLIYGQDRGKQIVLTDVYENGKKEIIFLKEEDYQRGLKSKSFVKNSSDMFSNISKEDVEMLESENKYLAEFLEKVIGLSQEQISEVANSGNVDLYSSISTSKENKNDSKKSMTMLDAANFIYKQVPTFIDIVAKIKKDAESSFNQEINYEDISMMVQTLVSEAVKELQHKEKLSNISQQIADVVEEVEISKRKVEEIG